MAEVAIIIGNGFDLDMGLKSRYSDFIKSPEWQEVVNGFHPYLLQSDYQSHSLIAQLQMASIESQWFDIEEEIHKFVVTHKYCTDRDVRDIKNEFELIKKGLTKYLNRVSEQLSHKADKNRLAYQFLYNMQACPLSKIEIIFNYTVPDLFLEKPTYHEIGKGFFTYVHGSLRNNDIVLGCDLQQGEEVNRQLSFMYKYNMLKQANHVARNIMGAKEVIFFGHSVNEMDFCYFREYFKAASASPNPIRHLTFITYDDQSERNIKDNMRNQGISVTDLYNNLWTFSFIHTRYLYDDDKNEKEQWDAMMDRLLAKDRNGI